jgi:probable DNA metabolism protein
MSYLIYDGTFEGLLTAVFESYALKLEKVSIRRNAGPMLFEMVHQVETAPEKAQRVAAKVEALLGKDGMKTLWKATLSEQQDVGDILLNVIQYTLKANKNILKDYGHSDVLKLQEIMKKLNRERHRMTAFVRFKLATDQTYYATIEPDFDVLPLISRHFQNRYADQRWMIFDTKRGYGIFYDLKQVIPVEMHEAEDSRLPAPLAIDWDGSEEDFQTLWKNYFKSTNIPSRKNTKLHLQHVPKRYWKYLIEK